MSPELMHVTLAFLGEVAAERLEQVAASTSAAADRLAPFRLALTRIGRFPERGRPHTVWIGPDDGAAIARAAATVRGELAERGLSFDEKPVAPHVTLARIREGAVVSLAGIDPRGDLAFDVDSLHVVESVLSRRGSHYASRHIAALGAHL